VLAAGPAATVGTVREAVRAGARAFLDLGRLREELSEVLIEIEAEGGLSGRRGTLVSLFSPAGGVGVSTTAVNLAVRLAGRKPDQVALVDLKPAPGDLALLLDVEPEHTVDDVCRAWQRLDRKMLEGAAVRHRSGVQVLAQAGFPDDGTVPENTLTREAVRQICTLCRRSYAVTVADLPHTLEEPVLEAMKLSNFTGLIARPDVPGLRRARWALDAAAAAGVPRERFRLVLNRYGQSGQVSLAKVEEILGIRVFQRIPEDGRAVNRAVNRGVPLAELSKLSRISRSFSSFARSVQTSS
jgi:pilus assembly protein CpaE